MCICIRDIYLHNSGICKFAVTLIVIRYLLIGKDLTVLTDIFRIDRIAFHITSRNTTVTQKQRRCTGKMRTVSSTILFQKIRNEVLTIRRYTRLIRIRYIILIIRCQLLHDLSNGSRQIRFLAKLIQNSLA